MSFCHNCGAEQPGTAAAAADVAEVAQASSAEVEIARIQADRDVTLARIQAKQAQPELEADLARAEGKAEVLEEIIAPPPVPEEPIVVAAGDPAADPEPEPEMEVPAEAEPPDAGPAAAVRGPSNPWW